MTQQSELPLHRKTTALFSAWLSVWAVMIVNGMTVRNTLSALLFVLLSAFYLKIERTGEKHSLTDTLVSIILAAQFPLVHHVEYMAAYDSRLFGLLTLGIVLLGLFILLQHVLLFLHHIMPDLSGILMPSAGSTTHRVSGSALFYISFFVCFLLWLPYFLYSYPGIMSPDGSWQFEQAMGLRPWSNHHPAAHTAVLWLICRIVSIFSNDVTHMMGACTFVQLLFMAFTCAAAVRTLYRCGVRLAVCVAVLCIYALIPFNGVFAIILAKDTPFACIAVLFTCVLVRIVKTPDLKPEAGTVPDHTTASFTTYFPENSLSRSIMVCFYITGVLFCLFRSNGWYAFLALTPFLILFLRRFRKQLLVLCACVILTAGLVRGPLMNSLGVIQPDLIESLCVPLQQVSRVIAEGYPVTDEQQELISQVVSYEHIGELYNPAFADTMKELVRAGHQEFLELHKREFLELWIDLGLKHPLAYLDAWVKVTVGYWFPDYPYDTASIEGIWPNLTGVTPHPLIGGPVLVKIRELLIKFGAFLPVYGLLWSSGTYAWMLLIAAALICHNGQRERFVVLLPSIMLLGTLLIAAPIDANFRYTFAITLSAPVWLSMVFKAEE